MFSTVHKQMIRLQNQSLRNKVFDRNLSSTSTTTTNNNNKRRRHRFFKDDDDSTNNTSKLFSLKDFQQQAQVRNLYRQYLRLIPNSSTELFQQVRNEFRSTHHTDLARALSEGRRRYKDLSAMLSTVGGSKATKSSNPTSLWPWQQSKNNEENNDNHLPPKPKAFPPKASLDTKE